MQCFAWLPAASQGKQKMKAGVRKNDDYFAIMVRITVLSDLPDLAKFSMAWSIARSLCDSWASCYVSSRFDRIPACVRRTDGHLATARTVRAKHSIAVKMKPVASWESNKVRDTKNRCFNDGDRRRFHGRSGRAMIYQPLKTLRRSCFFFSQLPRPQYDSR